MHWTEETTKALVEYRTTKNERLFEDVIYPALRGNAVFLLKKYGYSATRIDGKNRMYDQDTEELINQLVQAQYFKFDVLDCSNNPFSFLVKTAENALRFGWRKRCNIDKRYGGELKPYMRVPNKDVFQIEVFYAVQENLKLNKEKYFRGKSLAWVNEKLLPAFEKDIDGKHITGRICLSLGKCPNNSSTKLKLIYSTIRERIVDGKDTNAVVEKAAFIVPTTYWVPKTKQDTMTPEQIEPFRGCGLTLAEVSRRMNKSKYEIKKYVRKFAGVDFKKFVGKRH